MESVVKMLHVGQKIPQNPNAYGSPRTWDVMINPMHIVKAEKTPGETHEVDITLTSGEKMTVIAPWASFCDYLNDALSGESRQ
jgi:hypothetical protein